MKQKHEEEADEIKFLLLPLPIKMKPRLNNTNETS